MSIILFTKGSIISSKLAKDFRLSESDLLSTLCCTRTENGDILVDKSIIVDSNDNRDIPVWGYEKKLDDFKKEYPSGIII